MAKASKQQKELLDRIGRPSTRCDQAPEESEVMDALLALCNGDAYTFAPDKHLKRPAETTADLAHLRPRFRNLLSLAVADPAKFVGEVLPIGLALLPRITMDPIFQMTTDGFKFINRLVFRDFEAALQFGLVLLSDESKTYGKALSQCRLDSCQRFYFAKRNPVGGPANRIYCSIEHRTTANNHRPKRHK